ncbi:MAG TPA: type II toxin-antitoxin system PemK/MazF family toxin [Planctomycetaceae bacterium]|nr:type II toxin-antitoxin system PemK/MazF family toxin [Planctomycetaceae bacterium]
MACNRGEVVLVPFPFRDQLAEKTRPAVVVSGTEFNRSGDVIVAAITSHPDRGAFDIALGDWKAAGLQRPSTVRMLLATLAADRIVLTIGRLTPADWARVDETIRRVIDDQPAPPANATGI